MYQRILQSVPVSWITIIIYIYIWIWIVFHSLNGVYLVFLTLVYSLLSPLCVILVLRQHMQVSHGFELLPTIYYMAWKSFTTENSMAST